MSCLVTTGTRSRGSPSVAHGEIFGQLIQLPPRNTYRSPVVHFQTFPSMSCSPHGLAAFVPSGRGAPPEFSRYHTYRSSSPSPQECAVAAPARSVPGTG